MSVSNKRGEGRIAHSIPKGGHDQWDANRGGFLQLLEEVRRAVHYAPGCEFPHQWAEIDCPPPLNIDNAFLSVVAQGHMGWGVSASHFFYLFP